MNREKFDASIKAMRGLIERAQELPPFLFGSHVMDALEALAEPESSSWLIERHEDIFTTEQAVKYLFLETKEQLAHIRKKHGLVGFDLGSQLCYHRAELDRVVRKIFAVDEGKKR